MNKNCSAKGNRRVWQKKSPSVRIIWTGGDFCLLFCLVGKGTWSETYFVSSFFPLLLTIAHTPMAMSGKLSICPMSMGRPASKGS